MTKKAYQKLVDRVRSLPGETIVVAASRCDGHTIFKPEAFLDVGLPKEVVDHLTHTHESDSSRRPGSVAVRHDDEYGHELDGFEDDEYQDGTGSGYGGACGGNYPSRHDDNGEYDQRRRVGSHR